MVVLTQVTPTFESLDRLALKGLCRADETPLFAHI
jgi:hypothetical protein